LLGSFVAAAEEEKEEAAEHRAQVIFGEIELYLSQVSRRSRRCRVMQCRPVWRHLSSAAELTEVTCLTGTVSSM